MANQPNYEPMEQSEFFTDGQASRPLVPGTVAYGDLQEDEHLYAGLVDGQPAKTFPFSISRLDLERGKQRFQIFCASCHDQAGTGQGMVVLRGFPKPPSYHTEELRKKPLGHYFQVISAGYRSMPPHAAQIPIADRWKIIAYVKALQFSRHAPVEKLPEEITTQLTKEQQ